jgi:hypothetical protein
VKTKKLLFRKTLPIKFKKVVLSPEILLIQRKSKDIEEISLRKDSSESRELRDVRELFQNNLEGGEDCRKKFFSESDKFLLN